MEKTKQRINQEFLPGISALSPGDQEIILELLKANSALGIRPIRNRIIEFIAKDYHTRLNFAYSVDDPKNINELNNAYFTKYVAELSPTQRDLFKSLADDASLLRNGIAPLSQTKKLRAWEKAIKGLGIRVPSWQALKETADNLVEGGLLETRKIKDRKSEDVYYIAPWLYKKWQEQKDTALSNAGGHLSKAERKWFLDV